MKLELGAIRRRFKLFEQPSAAVAIRTRRSPWTFTEYAEAVRIVNVEHGARRPARESNIPSGRRVAAFRIDPSHAASFLRSVPGPTRPTHVPRVAVRETIRASALNLRLRIPSRLVGSVPASKKITLMVPKSGQQV